VGTPDLAFLKIFPGSFTIDESATLRDYHALARFHYCAARPATICRAVAVRYSAGFRRPDGGRATTAAVAILSYPVPTCRGRERYFGLRGASYGDRLRFANAEVRTISRVIVHPSFRAIGLSTLLIRRLIGLCPTRYVEALARMGRAHPLFDRAGMTRVEPEQDDEPVYFILDTRVP
jgi:hypothetical protein